MKEQRVELRVKTRIPTSHGEFTLHLYHEPDTEKEHLAFSFGEWSDEPVLVRIHSECFTGDVLGSRRCDCGEQLQRAIAEIAASGSGVLVYLRQEGRGIGLEEKLKAYNLQDKGMDTVEANIALGHSPDTRDYSAGAAILRDLGIQRIKLLTNNPAKMDGLGEYGINVVERVPLEMAIHDQNRDYMLTKALRMNHLLDIPNLPA
jgi:GTP cyclohydrolase II